MLDLDAFRNRRLSGELKPPPVVLHLKLAEEFQRLLDSGEAPNRAWLARRYGLTRARVTQLLGLLRLHPSILDSVRSLAAGTPERLVTEKQLRRFVSLSPADQLLAAEQQLAGFPAWRVTLRGVG